MFRHYIYLFIIGLLFAGFAILFIFFPRSTFSELERRELKKAPDFSIAKLTDGSYTAEVSSWFSDSQPYRDEFMSLSMNIKKYKGIDRPGGEETFSFHSTGDIGADMMPGEMTADEHAVAEQLAEQASRDIPEGNIGALDGETSTLTKSGILVVGKGENVRALMSFGGTPASANAYVSTVNEYARMLGSDVKVYSMVVPIAMEFYCPQEARKQKGVYRSQLPVIKHIYSSLASNVHAVNVYTALSEHVDEDIYLRTDHHWSPRGAYYAAREFAKVAGVHQPDLSEFDSHTIHRFVGTMYGYSKDIAVKNAPEDFVYYTPKNSNYTTTFTTILTDKKFHVTGQSKPYTGKFFKSFKDGSGNAYLTFMGSDFLIVKVNSWVKNGRKLAILKDSYGNAVPGYLFGSFEEVHVLDFRYFPHNIVEYCKAHGITDFLFINNTFNACSSGVAAKQRALLTKKNGTFEKPAPADPKPEESGEAPAEEAPAATSPAPAAPAPEETPASAPAPQPQAPDTPDEVQNTRSRLECFVI